MLIPYRTAADPEISGEGSIDPLGIAAMADRLAAWMVPGMTARMWRPRFLTAISVAAVALEPFEEQVAADGVSHPWLVLEWYYVEAMARARDPEEGALRQVPGIGKARLALRERVPMGASRYLKTPKVFGFHGVYKRLATHLGLVDDELALNENGRRLARIWAAEQGQPDFVDGALAGGTPGKPVRLLREAVSDGLAAAHTVRPSSWSGDAFFLDHLAPHRMGTGETRFLREALLDEAAAPRGEVFRLLAESSMQDALPSDGDESPTVRALRPRASGFLRARLDAIDGYEGVARRIQEAWDRMRWLSAIGPHGLLTLDNAANDGRLKALAAELRPAVDQARSALSDSPIVGEFEAELAGALHGVSRAADLYQFLWTRHVTVQKRKPPDGKRPWFDETAQGELVARPGFRLRKEPPAQTAYVHPYRLAPIASFLADFRQAG